jgi:chromosome segregation protein
MRNVLIKKVGGTNSLLLKKLEAYGFKSFADKLDLEFGPGITAVVGPNGSGKSNITEAIRWVLGEQSAKNLRGLKMEDVIFVGSERRKPLGIAEVSLTLDNSDNTLPIDFTEVTITRRVFRSGESEFFINKVPCRLKDIYELFSDTGLGREAFSVIGQNQVDGILNNRPEERRAVFEEAAGITKYKNRKRESVRKLEETQQNLLRIRDILGELENQLEPLAEAAAKAEQYLVLENRHKRLDIELLVHKTAGLEANLEGIKQQCEDIQDKLAVLNAQLAKCEAERETTQLNLGRVENQCQDLENQVQRLHTECQQAENSIMLTQERIRSYTEKKQRLTEESGEYGKKITAVQQELDKENAQLKVVRNQMTEQQDFVAIKERFAKEIEQHINQSAEQVANSKDAVLERLQLIAKKRNMLHSAQTDSDIARRSIDKLQVERDENATSLANFTKRRTECEEQGQHKLTLLQQTEQAIRDKQTNSRELQQQQQQIKHTGESLQSNLATLVSRHKVLSDMQREFEGYGRGVKAVMSHSQAPWAKGICGVIADLLDVPSDYATAIEVALGGALQHIVTEDTSTAKEAIAYLKRMQQGRATLLPLDVIKAAPVRDYELAASKMSGSFGFAADLVAFNARYREIIHSLLGRVVIAQDMDAALAIARKSGFKARIVTIEGDIINPGGAMTGGSVNKKESGLLGRTRELNELASRIEVAQQEWEENRQTITSIEVLLNKNNAEIQIMNEQRQQTQIELAGLEKEQSQILQELNRVQKMNGILHAEIQLQDKTLAEAQEKLQSFTAEITNLESEDRESKEVIQTFQKEVAQQQLVYQQITRDITEARVRLASIEQEEISAARMIERIEQTLRSHQDEHQGKLAELYDIDEKLQQLVGEIQSLQEAIGELTSRRDSQSAILQQHKSDRYNLMSALTVLDKEAREARRRNQDFQEKHHEIEIAQARFGYDFEKNMQDLHERYSLPWKEARQSFSLEMDAERAEEQLEYWREEMRSMGLVNLTAIEEYQRVSERFTFLNQQAGDLEQAQIALQQVICEIDKTMQKQFMESFNAVAAQFSEVFIELFSGGRAELQLTEKENILETGIEIIAQPPGKKLQNLSLLSGGERSLTVIALLFAILRVKPAPFCIVDEIDAALDEANVNRFAQFLGNLAKQSQFIVITHRKGTMECASVMHGITMEEQGVSKLISVKFMDQAS